MERYKIIASVIILIASFLILVDKIFDPVPIQIILESGEEIITQNSNYYDIKEVILLVVSSFLIGLSAMFLYYNSEENIKEYFLPIKDNRSKDMLLTTNLLKGDERMVFQEIMNSNGEILQNDLVRKTKLSKVKMTRVISRLQFKGLIVKERYGLTNKIKLKKTQEEMPEKNINNYKPY